MECRDVTGFDPEKLPEFDILIGGPLASSSKFKGRRPPETSLKVLVQEFLRWCTERKPRYWIMENVPRIVLHLPEEIPLKWIGIEKPVRCTYRCAGNSIARILRAAGPKEVPDGQLPPPLQTHAAAPIKEVFSNARSHARWKTLGDVTEHLEAPCLDRSCEC